VSFNTHYWVFCATALRAVCHQTMDPANTLSCHLCCQVGHINQTAGFLTFTYFIQCVESVLGGCSCSPSACCYPVQCLPTNNCCSAAVIWCLCCSCLHTVRLNGSKYVVRCSVSGPQAADPALLPPVCALAGPATCSGACSRNSSSTAGSSRCKGIGTPQAAFEARSCASGAAEHGAAPSYTATTPAAASGRHMSRHTCIDQHCQRGVQQHQRRKCSAQKAAPHSSRPAGEPAASLSHGWGSGYV
jgi:hypothetical protein